MFLLLEVQEPFPSVPRAARLAVLDGKIREFSVFQGASPHLATFNSSFFCICELTGQFLMIFF